MNQPFFILGNPRSGTTIFRLMLNRHPQLVVPPECGFALWWLNKYADWSYSEATRTEFLEDFATSKKIENWHLDLDDLSNEIDEQRPNTYAELVHLIYLFYAKSLHKDLVFWGDKNNFYLSHLKELKQLFPGAKILFITRDGRDVACSYVALHKSGIQSKYLPQLPGEINEIAREWQDKNQRIIDYCSAIDPGQWHQLKFEDLLTETELELKKVCAFLGVAYNNEMLNYHQDDTEPEDTLQWKLKTKQAPDLDNIGKFKHQLSEAERMAFEEIAGGMLKRFNYC